jgi:hypothetical protein
MVISLRYGTQEAIKYAAELLEEGYEVTILHGKKAGYFEIGGHKPPDTSSFREPAVGTIHTQV